MEAATWLQEQDEVEAAFARELGDPLAMTEAQRQAECDRLLEAIDELERVRATKQAMAEIRRAEIDTWLESEGRKIDDRVSYLFQQLHLLARHLDYAGRKSLRLPHGNVGTQRYRGKVEIEDMEALVEFAKKHDIAVQVAESVHKRDVSAFVASSGVVPPGVSMSEAEDRFYIETAAGGRRYVGG